MKALLVKYLPVTNHKEARLKLIVEGFKSETVSRDYCLEVNDQAQSIMQDFCNKQQWKLKGFGTLPNGDFVGTLQEV